MNEFVIIQGFFGIGKMYIGLEIVKVLLYNKWYWMNEVKINDQNFERNDRDEVFLVMLIVCYINYVLDQFMNGILNFLDLNNECEW